MFHVGQKVLYVGHPPKEKRKCVHMQDMHQLKRGALAPELTYFQVYTIRDVDMRAPPSICLRLEEHLGTVNHLGWEYGYCSCGFKPLSEDYLREFDKLRQPLKEDAAAK